MEDADWGTARNENEDWSEDDNWENWIDPDGPNLEQKTVAEVRWQCVKCAGKFTFIISLSIYPSLLFF